MASRVLKSNHSLVPALAQLNIGEQGEQGPSSELPTEMLRAILWRVPIVTHHLIRLRLVSSRWKAVIEDICRDKKCLMIMKNLDKMYLSELKNRFNGHLKISKDFVFIQVKNNRSKYEIHFSRQICTLLANLFPNIEQFFIVDNFSYSFAEFNLMIRQWSSLTILSLKEFSLKKLPIAYVNNLCAQINNLNSLKKLDLNKFSGKMVKRLAPSLARVEHLSGLLCKSTAKIVPFLGARFTSLGFNYPGVAIEEITNWRALNAQFVSSLERFGLFTIHPEVLRFICEHFISLQMLRIALYDIKLTADMIERLALLTHLTEIRIDDTQIDLDTTLDVANLTLLRNIRILALVNFKLVNGENMIGFLSRNYVLQFGQLLSAIFPNVEHLTVKSETYPGIGNLLQPNLNLFVNLRSFNLILHDPILNLVD